jgi:2-methylcitrate dehydratase PrpD
LAARQNIYKFNYPIAPIMSSLPRKDGITRPIANHLCGISISDASDDVIEATERYILDTVGVAIAGAVVGAGDVTAKAITGLQNTTGPSLLFGRGDNVDPLDAAFINGTAAHCLDYDDVVTEIHVHPSSPMVPAIIAAGQAIGSTGKEILEAYIAGFEAQYVVAGPVNPEHYGRGWHATGTYGVFGAAAAVGKLLSLSVGEMRCALDIAASMASGLKKNFGSMAKPMHAGQAARAGLTATTLAAEGFTGTEDALGADGGFFDLYAGPSGPDLDSLPDLNGEWALAEIDIAIKKYPCCYFTHSSIAAAERLSEEHDFSATDIERITVQASKAACDTVVYRNPETVNEAKFSMPYTVASAITRDRVGYETFTKEEINDPKTTRLLERVHLEPDEDLVYGSHAATVKIELTNGRVLDDHYSSPPGTATNPLTEEELKKKFEANAGRVYDEETVTELYRQLTELHLDRDTETIFGSL